MTTEMTLALATFFSVSSAMLLVYTVTTARRNRLDDRIDELIHPQEFSDQGELPATSSMAKFTKTALPKMGTALMPSGDEERTRLKSRLIHAGFYGQQALPIFLGVKLLLMIAPVLLGLLLSTMGLIPMNRGLLIGACVGGLGMIGPSFWLDSQKSQRQRQFRRALPDALDVLVICLEGGLSLHSSLKRVSTELRTAHPVLAAELNVVQREIQLGRSPGEALQQMGIRTGLEEVRSLASVITQSERFGASLVRSLRVHADTLRLKRQQHAETLAQEAGVKILFPSLLFIFPAIFVVILGPAVFQIIELFGTMNK
jgi:tight adherence protein C